FFQAEDGIRDFHVTGVQTCALPISPRAAPRRAAACRRVAPRPGLPEGGARSACARRRSCTRSTSRATPAGPAHARAETPRRWRRSEEHTSELQSRENLVCRLLLEKI